MKAPRLPPWFWPLIESFGGNEREMQQVFTAMARQRLLSFRKMYDRALSSVHPYHGNGFEFGGMECSEDHADDFAAWVVSRGHEFWDDVRRHPENGPDYLAKFEPIADREMGRRPDFIAGSVFFERFRENITLVLYHPELAAKEREKLEKKQSHSEE